MIDSTTLFLLLRERFARRVLKALRCAEKEWKLNHTKCESLNTWEEWNEYLTPFFEANGNE